MQFGFRRRVGRLRSLWVSAVRRSRWVFRRERFRARIALIYFFKKKEPKRPVFVLCSYRTGSSLLIDYLKSHPELSFGQEVISPWQIRGLGCRWRPKGAVFRHIRHSLNLFPRPLCGHKIFFYHLEAHRIPLAEFVEEFDDAKWIVLYREHWLEQYLSYQLAHKTGRWSLMSDSSAPNGPEEQIWLDPGEALKFRDGLRAQYGAARAEERKRPGRFLWVTYEELAQEPQKVFDGKIFPFLGVYTAPVRTVLSKQDRRTPHQIIANYERVRDFLDGTELTQSYPL